MYFESIDLYIDKSSDKNLFLKRTKKNIYTIFIDLPDETLKRCKYENIKIEFHLMYDKGNIFFTRNIKYKSGRTILSCMKEMVKFLIDWKVENFGHFVVYIR